MENAQTIEKQPKTWVKVVKIIVNVIFYLVILFVLLVSIANIRAGKAEDGMANIFGRGYLTVASNSMEGTQSNSFKAGDMIVVTDLTNDSARQNAANNLKVGDVVTFYDKTLTTTKKLNSHRVVYISYSNNEVDQIYTMGDKYAEQMFAGSYSQDAFVNLYGEGLKNQDDSTVKAVYSLYESGNLQMFAPNMLRGTYVKTLNNLGSAANTIQKWGLLIVVLPLCIFLGFEIFFFVRNLMAYKKAKYVEAHGDEIEAEKNAEKERLKAELRKQILEEMNNEKEFKNQKNNETNTSDAQDDSSDSKNE